MILTPPVFGWDTTGNGGTDYGGEGGYNNENGNGGSLGGYASEYGSEYGSQYGSEYSSEYSGEYGSESSYSGEYSGEGSGGTGEYGGEYNGQQGGSGGVPQPTGNISVVPGGCENGAPRAIVSWSGTNVSTYVIFRTNNSSPRWTTSSTSAGETDLLDASWNGRNIYYVLHANGANGAQARRTSNTVTLPNCALLNVSGRVFIDNNSNGVFDAGDGGAWQETVQVLNSSNGVVIQTQTAGDGSYSMSGIPAGNYTIRHLREPLWSGWSRTTPRDVAVNLNSNQVVNYGLAPVSGPPPVPPPTPAVVTFTDKWCNGAQPINIVSWNTNTTNVTRYDIARSTDGVNYSFIPGATSLPPTTNQYQDNVVPSSNTYYYYHIFVTGTGGSNQTVAYTGLSDNCVPPTINAASTPCSGTGGNPVGLIGWTNPTGNISYYRIYRPYPQYLADRAANSLTDTSVLAPNSYSYNMTSINYEGRVSPLSNTANITVPWCDTTPPAMSWNPSSLNGVDPNGCFDESMPWPRAMDVIIVDNPPPARSSGVNNTTIQVMIENISASGTIVPWTSSGVSPSGAANTWRYLLQQSLPLVRDNTYRISFRASDIAGNQSTPFSYNFRYVRSCLDWIQTRGGNVHTEGNINAPGGP